MSRYIPFLSAENDAFSQKLPGSAAVLFRPYPRRGFAPPFTFFNNVQQFIIL